MPVGSVAYVHSDHDTYGGSVINDNDRDIIDVIVDEYHDEQQREADFDWVRSYAEAVARHFDDPASLLRSHAAGLELHACSLDRRAKRIRELAQAFRDVTDFDRRTT